MNMSAGGLGRKKRGETCCRRRRRLFGFGRLRFLARGSDFALLGSGLALGRAFSRGSGFLALGRRESFVVIVVLLVVIALLAASSGAIKHKFAVIIVIVIVALLLPRLALA
jgi:hypothetical protein